MGISILYTKIKLQRRETTQRIEKLIWIHNWRCFSFPYHKSTQRCHFYFSSRRKLSVKEMIVCFDNPKTEHIAVYVIDNVLRISRHTQILTLDGMKHVHKNTKAFFKSRLSNDGFKFLSIKPTITILCCVISKVSSYPTIYHPKSLCSTITKFKSNFICKDRWIYIQRGSYRH